MSRFLRGQDYLTSISQNLSPDALRKASVKLVIICNGYPKMIRAYRGESLFWMSTQGEIDVSVSGIFHQSIEIYADQTQQVHNALGMASEPPDSKPISTSGERIRRRSIPDYVRTVMKNSIPSFEMSGNLTQLGGEFVLGPGYVDVLLLFLNVHVADLSGNFQIAMLVRSSDEDQNFASSGI